MEELLIRSARQSDWCEIEKIFCTNRPKSAVWLDPERPPDNLRQQTEGEEILVAEAEGELLGFVSIWEPANFIHHLYVHTQHQGKGVGSRLVSAVQTRYPGTLQLKCGVRNEKALLFYRNTGWIEVSTGESEDGPYLLLELRPAQ